MKNTKFMQYLTWFSMFVRRFVLLSRTNYRFGRIYSSCNSASANKILERFWNNRSRYFFVCAFFVGVREDFPRCPLKRWECQPFCFCCFIGVVRRFVLFPRTSYRFWRIYSRCNSASANKILERFWKNRV